MTNQRATPRRRRPAPRDGERRLTDLVSVGPAMERDFERLGITRISQLVGRSPIALYRRLCAVTGERQDPCVLDVFSAAVAQAENPRLPAARRHWWYWSRMRKKARIEL